MIVSQMHVTPVIIPLFILLLTKGTLRLSRYAGEGRRESKKRREMKKDKERKELIDM